MKNIFLAVIFLFLAHLGCEQVHYPLIPDEVGKTIDAAGENNIEFMEAIVKYRQPADSLKLRSLFYLIAGMRGQGYKTFLLQDKSGNLLDYNIRRTSSYDSLMALKNMFRETHDGLYFAQHYFGKDIYIIASSFLISHVQRRFHTWQQNKWSVDYPFEMFTEKILPHRQHEGPYEDWDKIVHDTLLHNFQVKHHDPILVAEQISEKLDGFLVWDARYTENPTDPGWQELKQDRKGRTEDMAALLVAALRAYSIAATIDFCPLPVESLNKPTYWVQVFAPDGRKRQFVPFKDTLSEPMKYPKVFRRTYQTYNEPLPENSSFLDLKYHHLRDGKYRDVTHEYNRTVSLRIPDEELTPRHDFSKVFLHVQYCNQWVPVAWKFFSDNLVFHKITPGYEYALFDEHDQILYKTFLTE